MGDKFEANYKIHYDQCDVTKGMFISEIVNYLGMPAIDHGEAKGIGVEYQRQTNKSWIICKWEIDINKKPEFGDDIKLVTEAKGIRKFYASRLTEILDTKGAVMATAKCLWMYLDLETRKTTSVPEDYYRQYEIAPDEEMLKFEKIGRKQELLFEDDFKVRIRDIDMNNHVNNVRYVSWAIDTLDIDFLKSNKIKKVKIVYKKEAVYGEKIKCKVFNTENENVLIHSIYSSDETEIFTMETTWS